MADLARPARWAVRIAAALVALAVMSLGGWTHSGLRAENVDSGVAIPTGAAADSSQTSASAADSPPATTGPSTRPASTIRTWYSGASGDAAVDGRYGRWRGEPVTFGGTWDNDNDNMVRLDSICTGSWSRWNRPLDIAIGAIDATRGESWEKAATGAYDARWKKSLSRMKSCWGTRNPGNLYIRFAHEFNLRDMPWQVKGGQEVSFVKAVTRFSDLRYQILPEAKIVICASDGTSAGLGTDLLKIWPGKDPQGRQVANVYGVDTYNSWAVIRSQAEFEGKLMAVQSGQPLGLELHRQLAARWGVPFAVPEWSGNGDPKDEGQGADLPIYYQLMNQWFRQHAGDPQHPVPGQLLYEIQFNFERRFQLYPTKVQPKAAAEYRKLVWGR